ncbi:unannotated protein [freshwater metagenome]|uniref:Unannotated protein n=1 Tax=freshwater metagenome TaxID=449393 RepID=A0A6J7EIC3_9ZZZZ|nr:hypothetical protein [Actinomycetota bacterium]
MLVINAGDRSISESGGTCSLIDGTTYISAGSPTGVNGVLSVDGTTANFIATARGPDDVPFTVTGGFNCLGG